MVKPDGVHRGLVGECIKRFEQRGIKVVGMKMMLPSKNVLSKHYSDHVGKGFFNGLFEYMSSGPVVPMVSEGAQAVDICRGILKATQPVESAPGTIRCDFCLRIYLSRHSFKPGYIGQELSVLTIFNRLIQQTK